LRLEFNQDLQMVGLLWGSGSWGQTGLALGPGRPGWAPTQVYPAQAIKP